MKRYNFYLPEPLVIELRKQSEETGLTMSELMRRALNGFLANSKPKQNG